MSPILLRSLTFVGLLAAGLVLYSAWYGIKADRYDKSAVPFLESALPELTSWRYARLQPLLSPAARLEFESEAGQAVYRLFSKLGRLESQGRPQFMGDRSARIESLGDVQILAYQVPLQFETGPATMKVNLVYDGGNYSIHHFGIQSEIFTATEASQ
jgi:hypothetical protein